MRAPLLVGCALLFACSKEQPAPPPPKATTPTRVVTVIITGAENGYLLPTAAADGSPNGGAAAALARFIASEGHCAGPLGPHGEPACPDGATLLLSTGDNGNGAAISSYFHGEPTAQLMRHMGYAASAFGNHELDFGRPQFARNRDAAGMPYLAANVPATVDADSDSPLKLEPLRVFTRNGARIAVIGLTSPKTVESTMPGRLDDVTLIDTATALDAAVAEAKKQGAQAMVVLSDGCMGDLTPLLSQRGIALGAGKHCANVSATHRDGRTAFVSTGEHWQQYASATLSFEGDTLVNVEADVREVTPPGTNLKPEPKASAVIAEWKSQLDQALGEVIGHTATGLERGSLQMNEWLSRAMQQHYKTDAALLNLNGTRASLPAGPITKASVYDVIPFENRAVVVTLTGEQLSQALAHPQAVSTAPAKLDPKKRYTVATHNFIYFGGDGFALREHDPRPRFTGEPWQTAIIEWTKKQSTSAQKPLESKLPRR